MNMLKNLQRISLKKKPNNFLRGLFDQTLMLIYFRDRQETLGFEWPTKSCVPGGKKLLIKEDGKFYPCEKVHGKDFEIGDIESGVNYKKVVNMMQVYVNQCNNFCQDCWAPRMCGSCPLSIRKGEEIDTEVMKEICPNKLENLILGLKIYTTAIERNKESIEIYLNNLQQG